MTGRVGLAASKTDLARRIVVIRALWFTDCTLGSIGERLGISRKTVSLLAKRTGLPTRATGLGRVAQPAEVELAVKLLLSRTAAGRRTARAIREGRNREGRVAQIPAAAK